MVKVKDGDFVILGEKLGVIEEFLPKAGTYEDNGKIYASIAGIVRIDHDEKSISVVPMKFNSLSLPKKGDIIIGLVENVFEQRAEVSIVRVNNKDLLVPITGEIHISNVTTRYLKSMRDALTIGDIVRAKVISTHVLPVSLSIMGNSLGVIRATCVKCGDYLRILKGNTLICPTCRNREHRAIAKDYGVMFGIVNKSRKEVKIHGNSYD